MRSGIERLSYAVSIILVATLVGWMVAECVGLSPDDFQPLGLSPLVLTLLRIAMSFVGVFGFSIMFNSPVRIAATAGCIGAVSNTLRLTLVDAPTILPMLGLASGMPPEAAAFFGALCSGLLAHLVEMKLTYPRISLTVLRLSSWCRGCTCTVPCITCASSIPATCSAGLCVPC